MPKEIIKGFAILKKSAAKANFELGLLEEEKSNAIADAADKVISGQLNEHFPLVVWQTGSGTQSNMNVNEVLTDLGNEWSKEEDGELGLHPNEDVNPSEGSNDAYGTALHVAAVLRLADVVLHAVEGLQELPALKVEVFKDVVNIGRTQLQDAIPLPPGQELSGWH